jgi:hypothetical protein
MVAHIPNIPSTGVVEAGDSKPSTGVVEAGDSRV